MTTGERKTVVLPTDTQNNANKTPAIRHERTRMKAETVCVNDEFENTLLERKNASPRNLFNEN